MFFEGAPRLYAAGVTIPGLQDGDPGRIVVDAYPGVLVRAVIGRRTYKQDTKAKRLSRNRRVDRQFRVGRHLNFMDRPDKRLSRKAVSKSRRTDEPSARRQIIRSWVPGEWRAPLRALRWPPSSLPANGATNAYYETRFQGSGGIPPYSYAVVTVGLPPSLTLGAYGFTVRATDALPYPLVAELAYTLVIETADPLMPLGAFPSRGGWRAILR